MTLGWVLRDRVRRFIRADDATATMEFVITFPIVMMLFIAVFETSMILTRQVLLERTLDQGVRILRLTQGLETSAQDIRDTICNNTQFLPNCQNLLEIDLRVISDETYDLPSDDELCFDRSMPEVRPLNQFDPGANHQLMLIRACMIIDRILPWSGLGLNLARDDTGGLHMTAASIFVNEP